MKRTNKKGFTIVELVIVIAIIAILAAVLIPTFSTVIEKANISKALQEAKNAIEIVAMERQGSMGKMYVVSGKYVFEYNTSDGLKGEPVKTGKKSDDGSVTAEANAFALAKEANAASFKAIYGKQSCTAGAKGDNGTAVTDLKTWGDKFFINNDGTGDPKDTYSATLVTNLNNATYIEKIKKRFVNDGAAIIPFTANDDISANVLVCAAAD